MATRVVMPQLGESVVEGTVTKWLRTEGQTIQEMEALLEVNTDKVDTEIPSPASGTLLKILVQEGTTVTAGTVLAWIGEVGEVVDGAPPAVDPHAGAKPDVPSQPVTPVAAPTPSRELGFISPVVAKLAHEHNVDLAQVRGTGEGGRITKKDVLLYVASLGAAPQEEKAAWETPGEGDLFRPTELQFGKASATPVAAPQQLPPSKGEIVGGGTLIPHTTMRRSIAEHLVASKQTSVHVTTVMEANFSRVSAHYATNKDSFAAQGVRLTYTPYFLAAIVAGLKVFPIANSSWTEEGVLIHNEINLGMAVSLGDEGLIVPVIRHADGLSLIGLARAVNDLAERARTRKLTPEEVKGGTFTLTNHGISGSLFATPVINQPQCGILGAGVIQKRAVVIEDAIAIRPMVYLSLTFDHRILDGVSADNFLAAVVKALENWI